MFRDDDPGLAELRRIALGFPGTFEKVSHGRPVFCVPKMFAVYGGSSKRSPGRSAPGRRTKQSPGEMTPFPHSVLFKVDDSDRKALEQDKRFFYPAYMGPYGWLGLDFTAAAVDWGEVTELLDASYRMVAPKKLIKQLDEPEVS
jgi:predicted DNA-binding protein (MmcQ/YjbR family)